MASPIGSCHSVEGTTTTRCPLVPLANALRTDLGRVRSTTRSASRSWIVRSSLVFLIVLISCCSSGKTKSSSSPMLFLPGAARLEQVVPAHRPRPAFVPVDGEKLGSDRRAMVRDPRVSFDRADQGDAGARQHAPFPERGRLR